MSNIVMNDEDLKIAQELVDKINNQEYPKEWEGILKFYGKPKARLLNEEEKKVLGKRENN